MSKFATLALLGASINAEWSDYGVHHEPRVPHYPRVEPRDHPVMPTSSEARYLAVLLGMDENRIYPDDSILLRSWRKLCIRRTLSIKNTRKTNLPLITQNMRTLNHLYPLPQAKPRS